MILFIIAAIVSVIVLIRMYRQWNEDPTPMSTNAHMRKVLDKDIPKE